MKNTQWFIGQAHAEKYQSGNWIARRLVNNFMHHILQYVENAANKEVHEIGCGEGHILGLLAQHGFDVKGCDISESSLMVAQKESTRLGYKIPLENKSIYDLNPSTDISDTVLCCEVLEHLVDPEQALRKLVQITGKDLILSVPNEPIWHLLNIARGKYLTALGNTPGHYQHWTSQQFVHFVSQHAKIINVAKPLPWTLIHCQPL